MRRPRSKPNAAMQQKIELVGAASGHEAKRIHDFIKTLTVPFGIQTFEVKYGEDATGEPAVWIWFHIRDENKLAIGRVDELTDFVETVRSGLLKSELNRWPYVGFRNPPD